jgi:NADH-quinone oxidoreductase subunit L
MISFVPIAVLLPLAGFILLGIFGSRIKNETVIGLVGSSTIGASFVIFTLAFVSMLGLPVEERRQTIELFTWISAFTGSPGTFSASVAFQLDQLSIVMALVVTGVGFLIHVYSIGYMHGDRGFWRYFSYLNLFIFAMLNLILADNFLLMFLGWEGVGLCSYLLIGFWYEKKFTGDAAKKAFVVNRIGDFGFLLAMFMIFDRFGSLNFETVFGAASVLSSGGTALFWMTLLLFVGATGKSAQIPLYVWLPDAMAGPTPVSALIHAATMVTAGVYMVARCSVLYALAPDTLLIIAVVGGLTLLFAASIGLVQNDIKKVLAYSTVSQLGYMFLAMGVAAFGAGIFHLVTHAFFKALLFLGSGAVIHAMHDEQDIQRMGGLKQYLPITYKTFLIGAIAIAGIPPFAGFFSKDEILWRAFSSEYGNVVFWFLGFLGAAMTAFYMFRLVNLTFEGEPRFGKELHPHEAPKTMTVVLIVLAFLSIVGGFIGVPASLYGGNAIEHWLEPVFERAHAKLGLAAHGVVPVEYVLMVLSVAVALTGIWLARKVFLREAGMADRLRERFATLHRVLLNKYYVDEGYDKAIVNPIVKGSETVLWKFFDVGVIDGGVNGSATVVGSFAQLIRKLQNGITQQYALWFVAGILAILSWVIFR